MAELFLIFTFVLSVIALAGGFLVWMVKILKGNSGGKNKDQRSEQARLIQELYQGLRKMEKRVDSLETIMLDKHRKDGSS